MRAKVSRPMFRRSAITRRFALFGSQLMAGATKYSARPIASTLLLAFPLLATAAPQEEQADHVGPAPEELPGFASWERHLPEADSGSCLHCHQVAEIRRIRERLWRKAFARVATKKATPSATC